VWSFSFLILDKEPVMGLDMYAYAIKASLIKDEQVDINSFKALEMSEYPTEEERIAKYKKGSYDSNFAYWRKFNNLHGWMHDLYNRKGGTDPDFNCSTVRLMPEDIDSLEADAKTLKPREGFFFGAGDDMSPDDIEDVMSFVRKCRSAFANDLAVVYHSWW
jgi:hypothetical protein